MQVFYSKQFKPMAGAASATRKTGQGRSTLCQGISRLSTMLLTLCLVLGLFIPLAFYMTVQTQLQQPLLTDAPIILTVKPNDSAKALIRQWREANLVKHPYWLFWAIRWQRMAYHLQAGIYQVMPGESIARILNRIQRGDVLQLNFRITEGSTLEELSRNLIEAPYLYTDLKNMDPFEQFKGRHDNAEGLFFADTYRYQAGSTTTRLLQKANTTLEHHLQTVWQNRDANLPFHSPYALLIAASIIEKETADPAERKIIAGVLVNRLNRHMPLQMDPTVLYAISQQHSIRIPTEPAHSPVVAYRLKHEDLSIQSPYNTYKIRGLPPTPIAMVGKSSLEAAAHPTITNYLYFYAKGDGTHQFSASYREQQEAIRRYKFMQ